MRIPAETSVRIDFDTIFPERYSPASFDHRPTGKEGSVGTGQRVLVIDGPTETEEVLRAVLEPRGLEVNRVRAHAPHAVPSNPASLVVLHEDDWPADRHSGAWENVPRVIIGSAAVPDSSDGEACYLQKPYHYGELIRAIERLLATPRRRAS